jgi:hypothetical protein
MNAIKLILGLSTLCLFYALTLILVHTWLRAVHLVFSPRAKVECSEIIPGMTKEEALKVAHRKERPIRDLVTYREKVELFKQKCGSSCFFGSNLVPTMGRKTHFFGISGAGSTILKSVNSLTDQKSKSPIWCRLQEIRSHFSFSSCTHLHARQ